MVHFAFYYRVSRLVLWRYLSLIPAGKMDWLHNYTNLWLFIINKFMPTDSFPLFYLFSFG